MKTFHITPSFDKKKEHDVYMHSGRTNKETLILTLSHRELKNLEKEIRRYTKLRVQLYRL